MDIVTYFNTHNLRTFLALLFSITISVIFHVYARLELNNPFPSPGVKQSIISVSYNPSSAPFDSFALNNESDPAVIEEIDRDFRKIATFAHGVRTYGVAGPLAEVPRLAFRHGLDVDLGIAIDTRSLAVTRREIERGISLAKRWPNVKRIYVGNETLVRQVALPQELRAFMVEIRRRTGKPVTTGETWDNWINNPELALNADFIGAHILPYWEGLPAGEVVKRTFIYYKELEKAFPTKSITISEFGWPSRGLNHLDATPGLATQARVLRTFVNEAQRRNLDYNLVEAKDQIWKTNEGGVGQNWGLLYSDGTKKFNWSGPLPLDPNRYTKLIFGIIIGIIIQFIILFSKNPSLSQVLISAPTSQFMGFIFLQILYSFFDGYAGYLQILSFIGFVPLLILMLFSNSERFRELCQQLFGRRPSSLLSLSKNSTNDHFVSIHVPICNEEYAVVRETLTSLHHLKVSDYEVLVILNNYKDLNLRSNLIDLCQNLGSKFKFIDLPQIAGFKAGALNEALKHTSDRADIIAVVDADYVVDPSWLEHTLPAFQAPDVAMVQAPQDHRQAEGHWTHVGMNVEFGAFFDVGMVQRNEHNAIVAHGTMLLMRRSALGEVGGWDVNCIVEDTELGLRFLLAGWRKVYTNARFGTGLLPDDLPSYRRQRFRWAYGAMTILRKHWRAVIMPGNQLTKGQRYHFVAGWSHWIGDGISLVLSVLNVVWALILVAFQTGLPPPASVSVALLLISGFNFAHGTFIQVSRPGISLKDGLKGTLLAMSLQMAIARGVLIAAVRRDYPFIVTTKGRTAPTVKHRFIEELWPDALLLTLQFFSAICLIISNEYRARAIDLFAIVLVVQSMPYCVALFIARAQLRHSRRLQHVTMKDARADRISQFAG